jgi:hypothetical protein
VQGLWSPRTLLGTDVSDRHTTPEQKLGTFVRLLASPQDGEVLAAARAIVRTLKSAGKDIHALAERVENANSEKLSEVEMKKLYNAGYEAGMRAVESRQTGDFHNVDGTPDWHEIALFCRQNSNRLRENERTFVNDMASRSVWREPTEKQAKWLRSIFYRLGGKI